MISNVTNINIQNDDGETLLHQICERIYNVEEKRKEFILLLLEKGSNPSIKDKVFLFYSQKNNIFKK